MELLAARDVSAMGFLVTGTERSDDPDGRIVFTASRAGSSWTLGLGGRDDFTGSDEVDAYWQQEILSVADLPGDQKIDGLGDAAIYLEGILYVRHGRIVFWVFADQPGSDPPEEPMAKIATEGLARRALPRFADHDPWPPPTLEYLQTEEELRAEIADSERESAEIRASRERAERIDELRRDRSRPPEEEAELEELERLEQEHLETLPAPDPFVPEFADGIWGLLPLQQVLRMHWDKLVPGQTRLGKNLVARYDRTGHDHLDLVMALQWADYAENPHDARTLRLAFWFHAAVCDRTGAPDFDASADLAHRFLTKAGESDAQIAEVLRLLRAMPVTELGYDDLLNRVHTLTCIGRHHNP